MYTFRTEEVVAELRVRPKTERYWNVHSSFCQKIAQFWAGAKYEPKYSWVMSLQHLYALYITIAYVLFAFGSS